MSVNPNEPGAAPAPSPAPEPDFSDNALHKKANGDWMKANESYFNAVNELGNVHQQLNAERAARAQLEAMVMAAAGKQAPDNQDPFAALADIGISPDAVNNAISKRAEKLVEDKLTSMLGPVVNQFEAEEKLASEIENFDQHKSEARAFMKKNTEVGETFKAVLQSNPVAAWKYAIKEMLIAKQADMPRSLPPRLPNGRFAAGPLPGTSPLGDDHQAVERKGFEYMHQYGDSSAYRAARFKGTSIEAAIRQAMRDSGYDPD